MNFEWEMLFKDESTKTFRAKVIGGWILNNLSRFKEENTFYCSESTVFIPDSNHEWRIR